MRRSSRRDPFVALGDRTRRALLDQLRAGEQTASSLGALHRVAQPTISKHLRVLREAGLVRSRRRGRERVYELHRKPFLAIEDWIRSFTLADPSGHVWRISPRTE